ncbi:hypothetical protein SDC9_166749 [bioreactor metagenome]|uniref:Uncharacterized protein n=1 Tax=bioreactor metagenome TaxID=1076179 RepID=A0A645G0E6_9ZZZZ
MLQIHYHEVGYNYAQLYHLQVYHILHLQLYTLYLYILQCKPLLRLQLQHPYHEHDVNPFQVHHVLGQPVQYDIL